MTAVLEIDSNESLTKLLKMAKITGIYVKRKKVSSMSVAKKIYQDEKEWEMRRELMKLTREIQQEAKAAGLDKMTLEEINAEIAEARRERAMRECCA